MSENKTPTPRTDKWEYEQECNFEVCWEENCRELERELQSAQAENGRLREALRLIEKSEPCTEGGGCFYPRYDGEGNYLGEENVDPLGVIQYMTGKAKEAISYAPKSEVKNQEFNCPPRCNTCGKLHHTNQGCEL